MLFLLLTFGNRSIGCLHFSTDFAVEFGEFLATCVHFLSNMALFGLDPGLVFGIGLLLGKGPFGNAALQVLAVKDPFIAENGVDRVGGLGTLHQPLKSLIAIDIDGGRLGNGVVNPQLLNEFAIPWRAGIGYDDVVKGSLLSSLALKSDLNGHLFDVL